MQCEMYYFMRKGAKLIPPEMIKNWPIIDFKMVEFFPIDDASHIPSEWHCTEKSTKKSYILVNLPRDSSRLHNTQVLIPVSYVLTNKTGIIDLKFSSMDIDFSHITDDKTSSEKVQYEGTSTIVAVRVISGDGFRPQRSAAQIGDDILNWYFR